MNDAGENNEERPVAEDAVPTTSAGPGMVGLGEQIGRYKLLRVLGEAPLLDTRLTRRGRSKRTLRQDGKE